MRTLKKALCLVLVLAMVLSLGVSAFAVDSANEFTDYSKVTNKEAVDVLTALGVINGNTDGTFGPEGTFTRAQAATMISYLTLGTKVANALPASATQFNDVPASHWAAKYVQYCAGQGIINGYGDGKFGPDDKLTANQWALMLLGALGYNAKNEQIGGTGWEIATTRLAMNAGIASAEDLTGTFTRDVAAKMAFKTLTATEVEYTNGGTSITVGDTTINTGASKATAVPGSKEPKANYDGKTGDGEMQFCEDHFSNLKQEPSTKDAAGRPGHKWSLKDKAIGTYANAAALTYVNSLTKKTLDDLQKDSNYDFSKATITYNGGTDANVATLANLYNSNTKNTAINGYTIEIFAGDDKVVTDIVVTEAFFAQVGKTTAAKGSNPAKIEIEVMEHNSKVKLTVVDDPKSSTDMYNTLSRYDEKDYVAVFCKPGWATNASDAADYIFDVQDVTAVEGQITRFTNGGFINTSRVAIAGTTYNLNSEFVTDKTAGTNADAAAVATAMAAGSEGTLYLDVNGCALGWVATTTATTNKAILVTNYFSTLEDGKLVNKVEGVLSTGETTELTVQTPATSADLGVMKSYAETSDNSGIYVLNALDAKDATQSAGEIKANALRLNGNYFASDVKFIFFTKESNGSVTVTVKDGVQRVPAGTTYYVVTSGDTTKYVNAVFVSGSADTGVATSDDIVFVTGTPTAMSVLDSNNKAVTVYGYTAYVNGEQVEDFYATTNDITTGFYKTVIDAKGAYVLKNNAYTATTGANAVADADITAYAANVMTAGADYAVGTADVTDLTAQSEGIEAGNHAYVIYNAETMVASYVYVTD